MPHPLSGKTALVTGASRRRGIGFAIARELAALGASVFIHHYRPHDDAQPWGGDDPEAVLSGIRDALRPGAVAGDRHADLRDARAAEDLLDAASALTGSLDILVCNQALSGTDGGILDMDADRLDAHWLTDARASLLLTAGFARRKREAGVSAPFAAPTGHVIWMTSGQGDGPMRGEVAYATAKAGLAGATATVAAELLDLGIVLNTVNPGPVNTGYLDPATTDRDLSWLPDHLASTPFGRFGTPEDPARLIGWLCTDAGAWVVGQVLRSDGGFALR
ncbi:SDR family oxidoreductase [Microbacterium soli]|uniref:SDR family oxidoreductase n=1 Tax=Microbacterium soli TaxID=446075 RepID=A0ABP7MSE6_9MICO